MYRVFLLNLFFVFISFIGFSQNKVSGTILDINTQLPIAYVNIGFSEKGIGTVSDINGQFELKIPVELEKEVLQISHVGYENRSISIQQLLKSSEPIEILLVSDIVELNAITINASEYQVLGYKPSDDRVKGFFEAKGLGAEGGTIIRNRESCLLTNFYMNITKFTFDTCVFRLNLYSIKRNKPHQKVNQKDILFSVSKADTGRFHVNLNEQQLVVGVDFICSIELVEIKGKQHGEIEFSAMIDDKGVTIRRLISFGRWEKFKGYNLCFWLEGKSFK